MTLFAQRLGDLVHDRRAGEGGGVACVAVFCDVFEEAADDLAGACRGQFRHDEQLLGFGDRADFLAHVVAQFPDGFVAVVGGATVEDGQCDDGLAGGAGGVKDEQRVLGIVPDGGVLACCLFDGVAHQRSRPSTQLTSSPLRLTTTTLFTACPPVFSMELRASSTAGLSGEGLPRRYVPSAVTTSLASASSILDCKASAENPPNTTECTAPIRRRQTW